MGGLKWERPPCTRRADVTLLPSPGDGAVHALYGYFCAEVAEDKTSASSSCSDYGCRGSVSSLRCIF